MNYKSLWNKTLQILGAPSKAWMEINKEEGTESVQTGYVYPMVAICGTALFLGLLFGNGVTQFDLQYVLTKCCSLFISIFGGYFLSSRLVEYIGERIDGLKDENHEKSNKLVGYSMSIIFVLEIFSGLFPSFFILRWILQFYIIYIVWEGAKILMNVSEKQMLNYTLLTSVTILVSPLAIGKVFEWLSNMFI